MHYFPVIYSTLSSQALLSLVSDEYSLGRLSECVLIKRGFNDTYLVVGDNKKYVLRIYRHDRREKADVIYEIGLLIDLNGKGVPISTPITKKDGTFYTEVKAPEGIRYAVLFTYTEGSPPDIRDETHTFQYGCAVARLHEKLNLINTSLCRAKLNFDNLIIKPTHSINPFLCNRERDRIVLEKVSQSVIRQVKSFNSLDEGICHGDLHTGNSHINDNFEFFDFDFCGVGWRSYDLATVKYEILMNRGIFRPAEKEKIWNYFLEGYTFIRGLSDADLKSVPWFVVVRHLWYMGTHNDNLKVQGMWDMNDQTINHFFQVLESLMKEL